MGMRLKRASEYKYLGCVLNESGTDDSEVRILVSTSLQVRTFLVTNDFMCPFRKINFLKGNLNQRKVKIKNYGGLKVKLG